VFLVIICIIPDIIVPEINKAVKFDLVAMSDIVLNGILAIAHLICVLLSGAPPVASGSTVSFILGGALIGLMYALKKEY